MNDNEVKRAGPFGFLLFCAGAGSGMSYIAGLAEYNFLAALAGGILFIVFMGGSFALSSKGY